MKKSHKTVFGINKQLYETHVEYQVENFSK